MNEPQNDAGQEILEGIVNNGGLFSIHCSKNDEHACIIVWSSGAAEQLEAIATNALGIKEPPTRKLPLATDESQGEPDALACPFCGGIPTLHKADGPQGEALQLLWKFFDKWTRCESSRGCYSCCEEHDSRCPKTFGRGGCECGRDELYALENRLLELRAGRSVSDVTDSDIHE